MKASIRCQLRADLKVSISLRYIQISGNRYSGKYQTYIVIKSPEFRLTSCWAVHPMGPAISLSFSLTTCALKKYNRKTAGVLPSGKRQWHIAIADINKMQASRRWFNMFLIRISKYLMPKVR